MKKILIGSLLLCLFCTIIYAAPKPKPDSESFKLVNADKMYLSRSDQEQILELVGKVNFFYGKTEFRGDRAIIFDKQKIVRMTGNVIVSNDTLSLRADTLAYYRIPELLNLGGNVSITEKKPSGSLRTFSSEYGSYDRKEDKLSVWKNVRSYDKEENAYAQCGYGFWDRKAGYAYLIEEPQFWAGKEDTLRVIAEKMEFFDRERKLVATFNVSTQSKDYQIDSDFLIYFLKEDKAVFTGKPIFKSGYATARAQEFYLYQNDRKPVRAELRDSCEVFFAEEEGLPKTNWVKANNVIIEFADSKIRRFEAEDQVSYYFEQEQKDKRDFVHNQAEGQYLEANFNEDNKLQFMRMRKGIQGKYKFNNNS